MVGEPPRRGSFPTTPSIYTNRARPLSRQRLPRSPCRRLGLQMIPIGHTRPREATEVSVRAVREIGELVKVLRGTGTKQSSVLPKHCQYEGACEICPRFSMKTRRGAATNRPRPPACEAWHAARPFVTGDQCPAMAIKSGRSFAAFGVPRPVTGSHPVVAGNPGMVATVWSLPVVTS